MLSRRFYSAELQETTLKSGVGGPVRASNPQEDGTPLPILPSLFTEITVQPPESADSGQVSALLLPSHLVSQHLSKANTTLILILEDGNLGQRGQPHSCQAAGLGCKLKLSSSGASVLTTERSCPSINRYKHAPLLCLVITMPFRLILTICESS